MVNGYIIVPQKLIENYISPFVEEICEVLNYITKFPILKYEEIDASSFKKNDVLILIAIPSHAFNAKKLKDLHKDIRLILYQDDLRWENNNLLNEIEYFFNRSLMIISPNYDKIYALHPHYVHKVQYVPLHLTKCFLNIKYNHNPIYKCLLSGSLKPIYNIRNIVKNSQELSHIVDVLEHPTYAANKIHDICGEKYGEKINEYFCAIADGGELSLDPYHQEILIKYNTDWLDKCCGQIVKKYYEIPASGALLLAEYKSESHHNNIESLIRKKSHNIYLENLGFEDMVNFVKVTPDNVVSKIQEIIADPFKFEMIRMRGYDFVRQNHTIENRFHLYENCWKKFLKYYNN